MFNHVIFNSIFPSSTPLPASVLGYYYGAGFTDHGINGNDLTQVGTVPQSASPTPPISSNWLADNQNDTGGVVLNYLSIPSALSKTEAQGVIEYYIHIPSTANYAGASIWTKFNDFSDREFAFVDNAGGTGWLYYNGGTPFYHTFTVSLDADHFIRCEWDAVSTRYYVDGVLRATGGTAPIKTYATFDIGYDGLGSYSTSACKPFMNGFMISNDPAEVYPPV